MKYLFNQMTQKQFWKTKDMIMLLPKPKKIKSKSISKILNLYKTTHSMNLAAIFQTTFSHWSLVFEVDMDKQTKKNPCLLTKEDC